jgi:hypothetical protein
MIKKTLTAVCDKCRTKLIIPERYHGIAGNYTINNGWRYMTDGHVCAVCANAKAVGMSDSEIGQADGCTPDECRGTGDCRWCCADCDALCSDGYNDGPCEKHRGER